MLSCNLRSIALHSTPKGPPASGPGVNGMRQICTLDSYLIPIGLITTTKIRISIMSGAPPLVEPNSMPEASPEALKPMKSAIGDQPSFKVYKPSTIASPAPPPSLPDEYFNPTPADLKAAQSTLAARSQALVNAPLELRSVRDAREQKKRERWPNLERTFPSTDKIRSVYAFVRNSLREDVKPIKFILYQSPPKRDLKVSDPQVRDLSLVQLQLAPSSVLLLRFEDESLNGSDVPAPLQASILAQAIDLPTPPTIDGSVPSGQASSPGPSSGTVSLSGEKKIPKWLKMGLKK
ncbi:hypothetical protein DXG01_007941 [Tephrocybe rancida]|nr:hypothetical protein DXG01_007941 [Tephrocybe rancida]